MATAIGQYPEVIEARSACYRMGNTCGLQKLAQCPKAAELVNYTGVWYFLTPKGLYFYRANHPLRRITQDKKKLRNLKRVFTADCPSLSDEQLEQITLLTTHSVGTCEQGIFYQKTESSDLATLAQSQLALLDDIQCYLKQWPLARNVPAPAYTDEQKKYIQHLAPRLGFFIALRLAHSLSAWVDPDELQLLVAWSQLECLSVDLRRQLENLACVITQRELNESPDSQRRLQDWHQAWVKDEKDRLIKLYDKEIDAFWAKIRKKRKYRRANNFEAIQSQVMAKEIKQWSRYVVWCALPFIGRIVGLWGWLGGYEKRRERVAYWHAVEYVDSIGKEGIAEKEQAEQAQRLQTHSYHLENNSVLNLWYEEQLTMFTTISPYGLSQFASKESEAFKEIQSVYAKLQQLSSEAEAIISNYWVNWLEGQEIPVKIRLGAAEQARLLAQKRANRCRSLERWGERLNKQYDYAMVSIRGQTATLRNVESQLILLATFESALEDSVAQMRERAQMIAALTQDDALLPWEDIEAFYATYKADLAQKVEATYLPQEEKLWLKEQFEVLINQFKQRLAIVYQKQENLRNSHNQYPLNENGDGNKPENKLNNILDSDDLDNSLNAAANPDLPYDIDVNKHSSDEEQSERIERSNIVEKKVIKAEVLGSYLEEIQREAKETFTRHEKSIRENASSDDDLNKIYSKATQAYEDYQQRLKDSGAEPYLIDQGLQLLKVQWSLVECSYQSQLTRSRINVEILNEVNQAVLPAQITVEDLYKEEPFKSLYLEHHIAQLKANLYARYAEMGLSLRKAARDYIEIVLNYEGSYNYDKRLAWQKKVDSDGQIQKIKQEITKQKKAWYDIHPQGNNYLGDREAFKVIENQNERDEIMEECTNMVKDAYAFWQQVSTLWVEAAPQDASEANRKTMDSFYDKPLKKRLTREALEAEKKRLDSSIDSSDFTLEQQKEEIENIRILMNEFNQSMEKIRQKCQGKEQERQEKERERQEKVNALKIAEKYKIKYAKKAKHTQELEARLLELEKATNHKAPKAELNVSSQPHVIILNKADVPVEDRPKVKKFKETKTNFSIFASVPNNPQETTQGKRLSVEVLGEEDTTGRYDTYLNDDPPTLSPRGLKKSLSYSDSD